MCLLLSCMYWHVDWQGQIVRIGKCLKSLSLSNKVLSSRQPFVLVTRCSLQLSTAVGSGYTVLFVTFVSRLSWLQGALCNSRQPFVLVTMCSLQLSTAVCPSHKMLFVTLDSRLSWLQCALCNSRQPLVLVTRCSL